MVTNYDHANWVVPDSFLLLLRFMVPGFTKTWITWLYRLVAVMIALYEYQNMFIAIGIYSAVEVLTGL